MNVAVVGLCAAAPALFKDEVRGRKLHSATPHYNHHELSVALAYTNSETSAFPSHHCQGGLLPSELSHATILVTVTVRLWHRPESICSYMRII